MTEPRTPAPGPPPPSPAEGSGKMDLEASLGASQAELDGMVDLPTAGRFIAERTAALFAAATSLELAATPVAPALTFTAAGPVPGEGREPSRAPVAALPLELPLRARATTLGALRLFPAPGAPSPPPMRELSDWARHVALVLDGLMLAAELRATRADLEEVDLRLQELVARMGHDLRAPLGAVLMWIHVAREAPEPERRDALDAIEAGTREQNNLIAELIELTRARVGLLELERAPVRMATLVDQAIAQAAAQARGHDLRIERPTGGGESAMVMGDGARLARALTHVLSHAIRMSRHGGLITLACVGEHGAPGWVRFEVRGPFGETDLPTLGRLLSPFSLTGFRAERDATSLVFGLSFAREIVALHGGTLTAAGDASAPVAVVVRLPTTPPDRGAQPGG